MTQQVEQSAREAARGSGPSPSASEAARPQLGNGSAAPHFLWPVLFEKASPAERAAWLKQAETGGVLYAHQLPSTPPESPKEPEQALLSRLLAGQAEPLESWSSRVQPAEFSPLDSALDDVQQQAASKALHCPDLFLIQGLPGTGKSRVLAELISQAAARGQRVLFLSPCAAAVDRVLCLVADRTTVLPLRCLGPHENLQTLPASVQALTFEAYARRLTEESCQRAQNELQAGEQRCQKADGDLKALAGLRPVAIEWHDLKSRRQGHVTRRQELPAQVQREAEGPARPGNSEASFLPSVQAEQQRHGTALAKIEESLAQANQAYQDRLKEHQRWIASVQTQTRLLDAKKHKRFWTLAWWRVLLQGRAEERLAEFQCREGEARVALSAAEAQVQELQSQRALEKQHHTQALDRLVEVELARRQAEIDEKIEELTRGQEQLREAWLRSRAGLQAPDSLPETPCPEAVVAASQALEERLPEFRRQGEFARAWCAALKELAPSLPAQLMRYVNVIAGPVSLLSDASQLPDSRFDLLICDQAEKLTEQDIVEVAARAGRWVLVGQPPLAHALATSSAGSNAKEKTKVPSPGPFQRLWELLHCDPRRLLYEWIGENNTLTCRLRPIAAEQRGWIEIEHLADQPEVELRILALPRTKPVLAEVVFPARSFTIEQAKGYLYQHLEELTLCPTGGCLRWQEDARRLVLHLGQHSTSQAEVSVPLEEGVQEVLASAPAGAGQTLRWTTTRLEFDGQRGWDRSRAERWLKERAGLADLERTALLETQWRSCADLACFSAELLMESPSGSPCQPKHAQTPAAANGQGTAIHFTPVPSLPPAARSKTKDGTRSASGKPGQGLELDLADPRQRQRLPVELRGLLPMKGTVNLAEAEAILHALEALVRESGSALPGVDGTKDEPAAAVLSHQPAQVQLLKWLWDHRKPAGCKLSVCFETAGGFREREAQVVLFSLCRSNGQRAVSFAEDPWDWRVALTAARTTMLLFGDVSTLSRRSQWTGPLERQDETTSAWERAVVGRLLDHVTNQNRQPRLVLVREGLPP